MNKAEKLLKIKNLMKDINKGHDDIVLDFASNQETWVVANSGVVSLMIFVVDFHMDIQV